jgi:uncharacterized protein (DUF2235 family)
MPKNIVICCDGTGNQLNETYSNVVKIFSVLSQDGKQIAFYDPGVGTLSDPNALVPWSKQIEKIWGLAFGFGLIRNVSEAYEYLMDHYETGDKLFFFGFSRGAYTVRVLAGLICEIGLLRKGCQNLISYAIQAYKISYKPENKDITKRFKQTYSQEIFIDFMGVWDTVTSIGLFNTLSLPKTTTNPFIKVIRHAVAIDERRAYYRQNLFIRAAATQDIKEVWFAGVHSDVGGSYAQAESGLSQLALEWMIGQSMPFGLVVDPIKLNQVVLNVNTGNPRPDPRQEVHSSLSGLWWILEYLPRRKRRTKEIFIPGARPRTIPEGSLIHASVFLKKKIDPKYAPKNLPVSYQTVN